MAAGENRVNSVEEMQAGSERIRQAAGSVKERAKGMNSEEKENVQQETPQEQPEAEQAQQEERAITGITRYLQQHLAEDMSLTVLAEVFHLSPQYISQLFKNEIGVGFLAYLTNIRMETAKKLLLATSLSIAEVAEQSGYGDYRVFTKVFKKAEGITPSQYRRDFLEETGKTDA